MSPLLCDDAWVLDESVESDVDLLMAWFPDAEAMHIWGGPDFRHPFNRHSFAEDMHWGHIATLGRCTIVFLFRILTIRVSR